MMPTPRAPIRCGRASRAVVRERATCWRRRPSTDVRAVERTFRVRTTDHLLTVLGPELDRIARAAPGVHAARDAVRRRDAGPARDGAARPRDRRLRLLAVLRAAQRPADPAALRRRVRLRRAPAHPRSSAALSLAQYAELEHVQIAPRGNPGGYVDELLARRGLHAPDRARRCRTSSPASRSSPRPTTSDDLGRPRPRRMPRRFGLRIVTPPAGSASSRFQIAQLWHPRHDRDAPHRWLREAVADAARRS